MDLDDFHEMARVVLLARGHNPVVVADGRLGQVYTCSKCAFFATRLVGGFCACYICKKDLNLIPMKCEAV